MIKLLRNIKQVLNNSISQVSLAVNRVWMSNQNMSLEEIPLLEELTTQILRTLHRISEEEMQIIPPLEEDLLQSIVYRIRNSKPWYHPIR